MYIEIDTETYSKVRNIAFSPEADLMGSSIPINEFQIEINTTDNIGSGQYAYLYDDLDNLWAKYWIVYAQHIDKKWVLVRAQSDIRMIDGVTLEPVMYTGASITDVLDDTMLMQSGASGVVAYVDYTLDSSLTSATITGYFPEQSARERLAQICLVIGAYVKTYFGEGIEIKALDRTTTLVPLAHTYWKPAVSYRDLVTAIRVRGYSFTEGTPGTTDEYVEAGGTTYIVTSQDFTLSNPATTVADPDNVVSVDGVMIVNSSNAGAILTRLSEFYFNRSEVQLDVINNAAYAPGDMVTVYAEEDALLTGFIQSCAFAFGLQAKSTVRMSALQVANGAKLVVLYKADGVQIGTNEYYLPVGYTYSFTNPYIDLTVPGHRYIYRPLSDTVSGTLTSEGATVTVDCVVALDLDDEGVLDMISVDEITLGSDLVSMVIA